jgi:hypothetical protein
MKTLVNSQYNPARGGHAPSDLRDAFLKTVEAVFDWSTGEPEPTVEVREREMPVSAVCGHLWNCRDVLPSGTMDGVDPDFCGRTYAAAARVLKSLIVARR